MATGSEVSARNQERKRGKTAAQSRRRNTRPKPIRRRGTDELYPDIPF